jgi:hypothetical protein
MIRQVVVSILAATTASALALAETNIPRFGLFEIALTSPDAFQNPFMDVRVSAEFRAPDGRRVTVQGFYYGGAEWRVRLAPDQVGQWSYKARLSNTAKSTLRSGTFRCVPSNRDGFVRVSKINPYRFELDSGKPFYPVGVQTCGYFQVDMDGPNPDGSSRIVPAATWIKAFEGATNLVRWQLGAGTRNGCALPLIPVGGSPDRYDTELAQKMDELLATQKAHGFSHIMVVFQDMSRWGAGETSFGNVRDVSGYKSITARNLRLQEAYIRYIVARFGCFVDIWEIFNEDSYAPDDYLAHLAAVIRKADPYGHPVTTNYTRPAQWNELATWHAYVGMPANEVDIWVAAQVGKYKAGKPVLNTEFGNKAILSNVDPIKWRVAAWAAFMSESNMLFWGMSGTKTTPGRPRGNSNAYLGPDSRKHLRVLNDFTGDLPIDVRPVECSYSLEKLRVYALANEKTAVIYVHHWADHKAPFVQKTPIYVHTGAGAYKATCIDPATGAVVHTQGISTRGQVAIFDLPPVTVDLACRLDREP